ncbi:pyridoxamine 5'-phosphate oxidase family protein [Sphingobacterium sp. Mn56C]|uniref:pyridoxamine 5'-phosphate oxidase family protein n=1 Tax=Sphingobacterium sp. Mn56C TaxID=3395261 RepID=UPI003BDC708E
MAEKVIRDQEAQEKLKSIVDQIDIGIICTFNPQSDYPHGVPMSRQEVDETGDIWYICSAESETYKNLVQNSKISIFYSDPKSYTFLSINGTASLSRDQDRIDKYWNKMMEGWFEKGKEDPNIKLLKVTPEKAHYWDAGSNKIATLFGMLKNAITGSNEDIGEEGELKI